MPADDSLNAGLRRFVPRDGSANTDPVSSMLGRLRSRTTHTHESSLCDQLIAVNRKTTRRAVGNLEVRCQNFPMSPVSTFCRVMSKGTFCKDSMRAGAGFGFFPAGPRPISYFCRHFRRQRDAFGPDKPKKSKNRLDSGRRPYMSTWFPGCATEGGQA